MKLETSNLACV